MTYDSTFINKANSLVTTDVVQQMRNYTQHHGMVTLDHCFDVASESYNINKVLHLHCDEDRLIYGALLHDFNLYDQYSDENRRMHLWRHPEVAKNNAVKYFDVDKKTQNIIRSHMWPVTFLHVPHSREAWVVCLADKICFASELYFRRGARDGRRNR